MNHRRIQPILLTLSALLLSFFLGQGLRADDYRKRVIPFVKKYCIGCHNSKKTRGELDFTKYSRATDVTRDFRRWSNVIEFLRKGEMPPKGAKQPPLKERSGSVAALKTILVTEAQKRAGDPGVILPRRLTRTEYDLSIRDLTGVDIRPTKDFPPDPAAGEGFNNTGEALTMSPSLLKKYLSAAQKVANHLVLKTNGVTFAPFPVTSYNERKKLTEQAIIDFYARHEVHIASYLEAAWRYRYRSRADRPVSISGWAQNRKLSAKYLALVWKTLNEASTSTGYMQQLGNLWKAIPPPPTTGQLPRELSKFNRFIEFGRRTLNYRDIPVIRSSAGNWPIAHLDFRAKTTAQRDRFDSRNLTSRHLVRFARIRRPRPRKGSNKTLTLSLHIDPATSNSGDNYVLLKRPLFSKSGNLPRNKREETKQAVVTLRAFLKQNAPAMLKRLTFGKHPKGHKIDPDSLVVRAPAVIKIPLSRKLIRLTKGKHLLVACQLDPKHSRGGCVQVRHTSDPPTGSQSAGDMGLLVYGDSKIAKDLAVSGQRFCHAFPNRFFYVDKQRGLAAGFHLVEGFFRDDQPLVTKVLNPAEKSQLDRLWKELHFVTNSYEKLIRGFVWFERSERHVLHDKRFDFLRAEDPHLVEEKLLGRFEKVYLGKMGVKLVGNSLKPVKPSDRYTMIHGFFDQVRHGLGQRRASLLDAERRGLRNLDTFARLAFRRSLRPGETKSLRTMYAMFRKRGQGVETALRGVLTAILMSPSFCYHFTETPPGAGLAKLSDKALASRLSFFLWSSLPDEKLLAAATQSKLKNPATLLAHTRRMTKSPKIRAFAREFFGQWLRYRDYLSKDPINVKSFPGYTDPLRQAMFEEPVRLATYLIQNDKPITELLASDVTFANGVLAKHYGGDIAKQYRTQMAKRIVGSNKRNASVLGTADAWQRVSGLRKAGRGGLFGMGVILTNNSAGERTSPVKRGFWTVHHLLGQHFPPPPTDVPELPTKEKVAKKTIRELIRTHTAHEKCAMCHKHFDALGFAMEGFDPIGRARTKDLAGRTIDDSARFPNGKTARGIGGLIEYVQKHKRRDFVRTLCRKFLGYALGRSVILSDQSLLKEMETALEKREYRFSALFETVVRSRQFRMQRGRDYAAASR